MEHTQGLVLIDQYGKVNGKTERLFKLRVIGFELSSYNAARRIIACWKACEGIKTEDLESVPDFALMGSATIEKVEQQRDELLEALKAMLTHMGMDEDEWNKPTFDQARAAIAKAEQ